MNILKQEIVAQSGAQLRPVKRGSLMSDLYPEGTFVSDPSGKGPTAFGSVAYRRPTMAELEVGTDPDVYVVSTVYDYMPVLPTAPPSGEGLVLAGDFASTLGQGLSDVMGGAGNTISSFWKSLSTPAKTALAVGGSALAAFPFLKAYLRNRSIIIGNTGSSDGSNMAATASPIVMSQQPGALAGVQGMATRPGTQTEFEFGGESGPDGSTILDVPVGFWKTTLALGKQYDARADVLPWDSMGTAMSGDPLAPELLMVPTIYVTDKGKLIRSSAPYASVVLAGGWKSFVNKVKKAVPKMLNSKLVKGVASFIPGGKAVLATAKAVVPTSWSKPTAKSAPVQVAEAAGLQVAPSAMVSQPLDEDQPSLAANQAAPIDVVQGVSLADALPPAWQGSAPKGEGSELSEEVQLLAQMNEGQMPLEGSPTLLLPALKTTASWIGSYAAYTAAPWVLSKVSKLWKKNPVATPPPSGAKPTLPGITSPWKTSMSYVPPLLPAQGAITSGFVKSLTRFGAMLTRVPTAMQKGMKALPAMYQGTVAAVKIGALLVGVGLVANMWWVGRQDRRALALAVSKILPVELREKWDAIMARTGQSVVPNLAPDEAQDMIALLMVAITMSLDAEERGVATDEHKLVLQAGRDAFDQIQQASPGNAEKAALLAASYIEDFPGEYAGSPEDTDESMRDLLGDAAGTESQDSSSTAAAAGVAATAGVATAMADTTYAQDAAVGSAAVPGTDVDQLAQLEGLLSARREQDPDVEAKVVKLMESSEDENQLAAALAAIGITGLAVTLLVTLWRRRKDAKASGDERTIFERATEFWNTLGAVFKPRAQRVQTIKKGSYGE